MNKRYLYVDCFGNSVSEEQATDHRGMLRDGFGIRQPMLFMDSSSTKISDAALWASTPAGAAAMAHEEMVADINRRPARPAEAMFRDAQAAESRNATLLAQLETDLSKARALADAAYREHCNSLSGRS